MVCTIELPDSRHVVARLRDGDVTTDVSGWNQRECAAQLMAALDAAEVEGYGECFWPEPTGHYWWMFRRDDRRLEAVVLWSRSSAVGWQHVFRAADEMGYLRDLFRREFERNGLTGPSSETPRAL